MGLRYPSDLAAWRRWQASRKRVRQVVAAVRDRRSPQLTEPRGVLHTHGRPRVLVVLDALGASNRQALLAVAQRLGTDAAVLAPGDLSDALPGWDARPGWTPAQAWSALPDVAQVLALGHFLPLSGGVYREAVHDRVPFGVVQHGLLTPFAPPLPPDTDLFAWSTEDAAFWRSARGDVRVHVTGSQLLYDAAQIPKRHVSRFETPLFLGQLHGAELPRAGVTRAAFEFCRRTGADYRPHPAELDVLSRLTHRAFERAGIKIDRSGRPLSGLESPVAAAFSTGVLEAAAQGTPSWVFYPGAPLWLREFWGRYRMSPWGEPPTPAPVLPDVEPAAAIAAWVKEHL